MLDDMPKSQSVALAAHPEDAIATMIRPPAKRRGSRLSLGRGREKVVRPSALGMLLRPIGIAVGIVLCVYAIVSLGTTFYRSYYRHLDHTARGARRPKRVRHLLRRQEPAAGCGRSRHQGCGRVLAQGRGEQVGSRQIRQRHDPDARRGAGAHQAGGARGHRSQLRARLPGSRRGDLLLCRLVLRVEALLCGAEGDHLVGHHPLLRGREIRVR